MRFAASTAFACIVLTACVTEPDPSNLGVGIGDPLPQFSVRLDDGSTVTTQSLRGDVAVIVFFSTSCPDCRRELPRLQEVYDSVGRIPGVRMFAVSREETEDLVRSFWEENGLTIPWSAQPDRKVYDLFATSGIPRIYITDKMGIITAAFGDSDFPEPQFLALKVYENLN